MDQAGGYGVAGVQHLVELRLRDLFHRDVAERVLSALLQAIPPVGQDGVEGPAAGAVADEAFVIAQFLVVGIDGDRWQHSTAMNEDGRSFGGLLGRCRIFGSGPGAHAHLPCKAS